MSTQIIAGRRVRRLRLALGLSQSELAERANIAAGLVSMIENDRTGVDNETSITLAKILDCAPGYLVGVATELQAGRPQLRAYADASQRAVDRTVADSITAIEAVRALDLPLVSDILPMYDGDLNDDEAIERFAGEVRSMADLDQFGAVGNVIRTAERLGCVVLPMENELGRHLGLSLRVDGVAVIRVSKSSAAGEDRVPGDRQRFTVAHELGHLVLHHGEIQPTSPVEAARVEKQAHRFASAFLVPGDAALHDLEQLGGRVTLGTLVKLKEKWGFSVKAFVVRFRQLGIIDDDHARSLYKQISARRWNKEEPVIVGGESAVWMGKAIKKTFPIVMDISNFRSPELGSSYFHRWTNWQVLPVRVGLASVSQLRPDPKKHRSSASASGSLARLPYRDVSAR